jgi:hypothetical protein
MEQIGAVDSSGSRREPDSGGFVANYEMQASGRLDRVKRYRTIAGVAVSLFAVIAAALGVYRRTILMVLALVIAIAVLLIRNTFLRVQNYQRGLGPRIMKCLPRENVPVLATLAEEFALLQRWFCSVPGETWPNRQFLHAGTSAGTVNIEARFYFDDTIFEVLERSRGANSWRIYFDGPPQVVCYRNLFRDDRWFNWSTAEHLFYDIANDSLPNYSFVEPNHGYVGDCNSQHPASTTSAGSANFIRGEVLLAEIYMALRSVPEVFSKTALVITYDEHGGTYDHVPPQPTVAPGGSGSGFGAEFDFTLLGPRVPTVVVSPLIERNTVSDVLHDHTSVPATLRKLFAPSAGPLSAREAAANTFEYLFTRDEARPVPPIPVPLAPASSPESPATRPDEFRQSLTLLMEAVARQINIQATAGLEVDDDGKLVDQLAVEFIAGTPPRTLLAGKRRASRAYDTLVAYSQGAYSAETLGGG